MIWLDRAARDPQTVAHSLKTLLAIGAEIEMILKQHAQQLTTVRREASLELGMLKPTRLLAAEPAHDHLKLLAGTIKPILARPIIRRAVVLTASKICCITTRRFRGRQDFTSRRVNFARTGAEVGDHVATFRGRRWY
jgi:hypothetical protein